MAGVNSPSALMRTSSLSIPSANVGPTPKSDQLNGSCDPEASYWFFGLWMIRVRSVIKVHDDWFCYTMQGKVAGKFILVFAGGFYRSAFVAKGGVLLYIEEIGTFEVVVAHFYPGVDGGCFGREGKNGVTEIGTGGLNGGFEVLEISQKHR